MSNFVESLKKGQNLSFEDSKALFNSLMEGKFNEGLIIEILKSIGLEYWNVSLKIFASVKIHVFLKMTRRAFTCKARKSNTGSERS